MNNIQEEGLQEHHFELIKDIDLLKAMHIVMPHLCYDCQVEVNEKILKPMALRERKNMIVASCGCLFSVSREVDEKLVPKIVKICTIHTQMI